MGTGAKGSGMGLGVLVVGLLAQLALGCGESETGGTGGTGGMTGSGGSGGSTVAVCGDGQCQAEEDCSSCPTDCGECLTVWTAGSLERIGPNDPPGAESFFELRAGRNETRGFQLAVRAPDDAALANVTVTASDLTGPGTIAASEVSLFREHYLEVTTSSPDSPYSPGFYPDALVPFVDPDTGTPLPNDGTYPTAPFPLEAGSVQPIYVDVHVPADTAPGAYTGTLTVSADGHAATPVAVSLTVWNFTLPNQPTLASDFSGLDRAADFHGAEAGTEVYTQIVGRYERMLLAHRLMPHHVQGSAPSVNKDDGTIDASSATTVLSEAIANGVTSYRLALYGDWPWTDPLGADSAKTATYIAALVDFLAGLDFEERSYLYPVDEPNDAAAYQTVRDWADLAHGADARARVLLTEQPWPSDVSWGTLDGYVDIWVPLFQYVDDPRTAEAMANGDTVWAYTALAQGPAELPHWLLDHPLLNYRAAVWSSAGSGIAGLLYWSTVFWLQVDDPWTNPVTYSTEGYAFNGEGSLFYPGTAINFDGPVPSLRLKALRDGVQDYEYFAMLRRAGYDAEALAIIQTVVQSWTARSADPADYETARGDAAALLEAAGGG